MNQILNEAIDRGWLAIALIRVCQAACHDTANGLRDQKDIYLGGALWQVLTHAQEILDRNQDFLLERMEAILEAEISQDGPVDNGENS
ncbi:hypothetical protein DEM27_05880 [Metarhizobium album]|uniref:Uncharacterized protein n=1 Tax=Metarhizobium album TaxID=2182425 RepID=A0A2U2DV39_9HYPH|nr:hypothetical protein [Rhizobium album]PWE57170.1 hypothetical protein DEM27_05880 [Rhizobium album]